jgi:hypothetical protein
MSPILFCAASLLDTPSLEIDTGFSESRNACLAESRAAISNEAGLGATLKPDLVAINTP